MEKINTCPEDKIQHFSTKKFQKIEIKFYSEEEISNEIPIKKMNIPCKDEADVAINKIFNQEKKWNYSNFRRSSNIYNTLSSKKNLKHSLLLSAELLLPNIFSCLFFLGINFLNDKKYCDSDMIKIIKTIFFVIFNVVFYQILGYYMLFPWILRKIPQNKRYLTQVIFFFMLIVILFIMTYLKFQNKSFFNSYLETHVIEFIYAYSFSGFICFYFKIKFNDFKEFFLLFSALLFAIFFHYYFVKAVVIVKLYESNIFSNQIFIKIIIFLYFQVYNNLINFLMVKFFSIATVVENSTDAILIFVKYFMADVICSSIASSIVGVKTLVDLLFSLFNFTYQVLVFYEGKNFIFLFIIKMVNYLKGNKPLSVKKNELENNCKALMAGSLNDILIVVYLKILLLFFFQKFTMLHDTIKDLVSECLDFNEKMSIRIEYVGIILILNLIVFSYIVFKMLDGGKATICWKLESYNILTKSYYIILMHSYIEVNLQFYFYLIFIQ